MVFLYWYVIGHRMYDLNLFHQTKALFGRKMSDNNPLCNGTYNPINIYYKIACDAFYNNLVYIMIHA